VYRNAINVENKWIFIFFLQNQSLQIGLLDSKSNWYNLTCAAEVTYAINMPLCIGTLLEQN